jgi:hypothetical protein
VKTLTSILASSRKANFNGVDYYPVQDITKQLTEGTTIELLARGVDRVELPFDGEQVPCITEDEAKKIVEMWSEKHRNKSAFDEKLMKALNFDPKK